MLRYTRSMRRATGSKILVNLMDRLCAKASVYQQHVPLNLSCPRGKQLTRTLQTDLAIADRAACDLYIDTILAITFMPTCDRPSGFGLGVSDEQTDQVELMRPPSEADFQGFPDAPTLHRLRQVSGLHVTDDTDPLRIPTNTGRSAAVAPVFWVGCTKQSRRLRLGPTCHMQDRMKNEFAALFYMQAYQL